MHRDQRGTTGVYAQRAFIREASNTIEHVMHFYRLKKVCSLVDDPHLILCDIDYHYQLPGWFRINMNEAELKSIFVYV